MKKGERQSHYQPPEVEYRPRYNAFIRTEGQTINLAELSNNDFKRVVVDLLCMRGLIVGEKTQFQLDIEKAAGAPAGTA